MTETKEGVSPAPYILWKSDVHGPIGYGARLHKQEAVQHKMQDCEPGHPRLPVHENHRNVPSESDMVFFPPHRSKGSGTKRLFEATKTHSPPKLKTRKGVLLWE